MLLKYVPKCHDLFFLIVLKPDSVAFGILLMRNFYHWPLLLKLNRIFTMTESGNLATVISLPHSSDSNIAYCVVLLLERSIKEFIHDINTSRRLRMSRQYDLSKTRHVSQCGRILWNVR